MDYSLWYGNPDDMEANLLAIEAKAIRFVDD